MSDLLESYTLFEAVDTAHNLLHPDKEIAEYARQFDEVEELVLAALKSGRLKATGFPRKPIYSATGQTHSRESIPSEMWELATTKPDEHRLRGGHYVGYLNDIDRRQDCGMLTFNGEADPSWIRIRVDGPSLREWLKGLTESPIGETLPVEQGEQHNAPSPFKRSVMEIIETALAEWHRTGRKSPQPTQISMTALVVRERRAGRKEIRAAFREVQKHYPDVEWRTPGPRPAS